MIETSDIIQTIGAIIVAFIVGAVFLAIPQFHAVGAILTLFAWLLVAVLFVGAIVMLSKIRL